VSAQSSHLSSPLPCGSTDGLPRERLQTHGPGALGDAELLALLIGVGEARVGNALSVAQRLIERFGGAGSLGRAGLGELVAQAGIGPVKAARVLAAFELGRRAGQEPLQLGRRLGTPAAVHRGLARRLAGETQEVFLVLALDARHRLLREIPVARGTLTSCPVHPREVFRALIREAAAACILVHNHPSGDPEPSPEDLALTRRLVAAGRLVGIEVLDHLVWTAQDFVSLAARGWLDQSE